MGEREGKRLWRWTDGDARLPLHPGCTGVELRLHGRHEYRVAAIDRLRLPRQARHADC